MGQAVEERRCHLGVAEDRRPFAEVEVRCYDDRGAFVEAADEVEQQLAARLGERQIAQFVEDQEVEAAQEIRGAPLPISAGFATPRASPSSRSSLREGPAQIGQPSPAERAHCTPALTKAYDA